MATTIKLRWHGACPKHPHFNPERGGGAIKGGCIFCHQLVQVQEKAAALHDTMKQFDHDRTAWDDAQKKHAKAS